jgi:hypothetical protein
MSDASRPREAVSQSQFAKFGEIGAAVIGFVSRIGENGNGPFLVMAPCGFRASGKAPFVRFDELAVGLSTDPASKIQRNDTGKILLLVFVATKPTGKDPLKIFNVVEVTAEEAREVMKSNTLASEWTALPSNAVASSSASPAATLF